MALPWETGVGVGKTAVLLAALLAVLAGPVCARKYRYKKCEKGDRNGTLRRLAACPVGSVRTVPRPRPVIRGMGARAQGHRTHAARRLLRTLRRSRDGRFPGRAPDLLERRTREDRPGNGNPAEFRSARYPQGHETRSESRRLRALLPRRGRRTAVRDRRRSPSRPTKPRRPSSGCPISRCSSSGSSPDDGGPLDRRCDRGRWRD